MNKTVKLVLILVIILLVVAAVTVGLVLYMHNAKYISKSDAIEIAMDDAGLDRAEIISADADFEKTGYSAWYEVELETHTTEYNLDIDAVSGEVLSSRSEPRD